MQIHETQYICAKGHIVTEAQRITFGPIEDPIKSILMCTLCLFDYVEKKFPITEITVEREG